MISRETRDRSTRRAALIGAAGALTLGVGGLVVAPALAQERQAQAVMMTTAQSAVTAAVTAAEEQAAAEAAAAAAHAAGVQRDIDAVVGLARAQVGDSYRMGASGPNTFDCSGLTMWVYRQALGVSLPHNTHAQWNAIQDTWYAGQKEPRAGDLVFFFANGADHVGLYVGDGMMVHAENPRTGVVLAPIYSGYWANHLTGFGRVIH